jgi:DNA-binding XRE family transcriptional regulator
MPAQQTWRKRRLGSYLARLRDRAELQQEQVAEHLNVHRTTINRLETGWVLCRWAELQALLDFVNATDDEKDEARKRWTAAKNAPTIELVKGAPKEFLSAVSAEVDASHLRVLSSLVVPALVQTPDYVDGIYETPSGWAWTARQIEQDKALRRKRQERLYGEKPLALDLIMDEAVIRREVGGPRTMRGQLERLIEVNELPHVNVHIVPFSAGSYGTMSGSSIELYEFDGDPDAAYQEYHGGGAWVEDEEGVALLRATWEKVYSGKALSSKASVDLIHQQLGAWT